MATIVISIYFARFLLVSCFTKQTFVIKLAGRIELTIPQSTLKLSSKQITKSSYLNIYLYNREAVLLHVTNIASLKMAQTFDVENAFVVSYG